MPIAKKYLMLVLSAICPLHTQPNSQSQQIRICLINYLFIINASINCNNLTNVSNIFNENFTIVNSRDKHADGIGWQVCKIQESKQRVSIISIYNGYTAQRQAGVKRAISNRHMSCVIVTATMTTIIIV